MKSAASMELAAGREGRVSCVSLRGEKSVLLGHSSHTTYTFCWGDWPGDLGSLTDGLLGNESRKASLLSNALLHRDMLASYLAIR